MAEARVLLLGASGKMGLALREAMRGRFQVAEANSRDFDAQDPDSVSRLVAGKKPDIIINAVALLGIDPCEQDPGRAYRLNTLYPLQLAELAAAGGAVLAHFSTDAVFNDAKRDHYVESDAPAPLNLYGLTKYGGDCAIAAATDRHYIFRIPLLFGETARDTQFVEKMLRRLRAGEKALRVADDIVSSPTYSRDAAAAVVEALAARRPFGLYHVANEGRASLYELMSEIVRGLGCGPAVARGSYRDFPHVGRKNTFTPIRSEKIAPLRPWREAARAYCSRIPKVGEA